MIFSFFASFSDFFSQQSVSETIQKAPLAEAQITLEKHVPWNAGICAITEILWKTAFSRKISLKSAAAELWPKTTYKQHMSTILNFKNVHIWSPGCHWVPIVLLGTKFHQNLTIFHWDNSNLMICNMVDVSYLNFQNLEFMSRVRYRHAILLRCAKFH